MQEQPSNIILSIPETGYFTATPLLTWAAQGPFFFLTQSNCSNGICTPTGRALVAVAFTKADGSQTYVAIAQSYVTTANFPFAFKCCQEQPAGLNGFLNFVADAGGIQNGMLGPGGLVLMVALALVRYRRSHNGPSLPTSTQNPLSGTA